MRDDYVETWQPDGAIEMRLVEQMVLAAWKLNRANRIEAQVFEAEIKRQEYEAKKPDQLTNTAISLHDYVHGATPEHLKPNVGSAFRQLSDSRDNVFPLLRYETTIERSFYRALHNLERIQERRRGKLASRPPLMSGDMPKDDA